MNENKRTIYDEATDLEDIKGLHDGENIFVSETVIFSGQDNSGNAGSFSCLTIKDIDGREFTVTLPPSFVERLTVCGIHHLVNKKPVQKSEKEFCRFKKEFRKDFDHRATDAHIESIYYSRELPICFISSNLHLTDLLDDADLSADILI